MSDFKNAHQALVFRILEGDGSAARAQRHSAFDNAGLDEPMRTLIGKVAEHANRITDEDFAAARASGLSHDRIEDQIFEMVVAAAIGQATRQYNTALAALNAAAEME